MDRLEAAKEKKRKRKAPMPAVKSTAQVAPNSGHLSLETHDDVAQDSGHVPVEIHAFPAQDVDQRRDETQSTTVLRLCEQLARVVRQRNQFMRAHLALEQQRQSLRMMIVHEGHRGVEGAMSKDRPWKCLLCEKYRKGDSKDHVSSETQSESVNKKNGQVRSETHGKNAEENGHSMVETQSRTADAILFGPFDESIALMEAPRRHFEKQIETLARHLPVWRWAEKVRGIGPSILGQVIGESGDLSKYANPGKLWKRFGLMPGAKRVRAVATRSGQSAEERRTLAMELGYSPRRRALMHVVGECLLRAGGDYYDVYVSRKAYEEGQHSDWIGNKEEHPGHLHKRAMRYMEKRFLRDLWMKWNGASVDLKSTGAMPRKESARSEA